MTGRRVNPAKIGAFVVGGLLILVAGVLLIGSGRYFRRTHPFVSYFDGTINGLHPGAAVKFKGVEVGMVDSIRIHGGLTPLDQPIAVLFSLDGDKLEASGKHAGAMEEFLADAIENGLRAKLEASSMVTGVLYVSLSFMPEAPARMHEPLEGVMEIPTIAPPLQEIGAGIRAIVDRLGRYPFERVFDSFQQALDAFTELSRAPELHSAFRSADQTFKDFDVVLVEFKKHLDPLCMRGASLLERFEALGSDLQSGIPDGRATLSSLQVLTDRLAVELPSLTKSLEQTSDRLQEMALTLQRTMESTRVVLDPNAPLVVELREGFREIGAAARATRALLELLERNPSALLRGKSPQDGESK